MEKQIETHLYKTNDKNALRQIAAHVQSGRLVVMPTDTVYGLGCDAFNEDAIEQLYAAKQRPYSQALPILLAEVNQLDKIVAHIPDHARHLIRRFWPGPLTIILPKNDTLPANISTHETIAVRIPDHPATRSIIRMAGGAMAVSSANLFGQPTALNGDEAVRIFNGRVAAVLDEGHSLQNIASTIVDCSGETVTILRTGIISERALMMRAING